MLIAGRYPWQYKASCSRHFISEDAQERQDKEVFEQNMKRRLESFKSTKHSICFAKNKPRARKTGRKKARGFWFPDGAEAGNRGLSSHGLESSPGGISSCSFLESAIPL